MKITIQSLAPERVGCVAAKESDIRSMLQVFSAHNEWVREKTPKAGVLDMLLDALPSGDYIVDTRVHMLKPGWFPCIPGWHLDDVPRENGQPDLEQAKPDLPLYLWTCGPSRPDFAVGEATFDVDPFDLDRNVYEQLHEQVEEQIKSGALRLFESVDGAVYRIWRTSLHRGTAATKDGWRGFFRATQVHRLTRPAANEIRTQTQVYLVSEEAGW